MNWDQDDINRSGLDPTHQPYTWEGQATKEYNKIFQDNFSQIPSKTRKREGGVILDSDNYTSSNIRPLSKPETSNWLWVQRYTQRLHSFNHTWQFWLISFLCGLVLGVYGYYSAPHGTLTPSSDIPHDLFWLGVYGAAGAGLPWFLGWLSLFALGVVEGLVEVLILLVKMVLTAAFLGGCIWIIIAILNH